MAKTLPTPAQQKIQPHADRRLTAAEFQGLSEVPPELEWFANLTSEQTRRAYRNDVQDFMRFVGIQQPEEFRIVTRPHVLAWRKDLEERGLAPTTIRRKLSAITSLFSYLCEQNAITHNPVDGVKRPAELRFFRLQSACAAGDGGDECAGSRGGYCPGAGVARACEYFDDAAVR